MRNFGDVFETRKQSFIKVLSSCMTVPLKYMFVKTYSPLISAN